MAIRSIAGRAATMSLAAASGVTLMSGNGRHGSTLHIKGLIGEGSLCWASIWMCL